VIRRNDHLTGNALLGAGAVHHIKSVGLTMPRHVRFQPDSCRGSGHREAMLCANRRQGALRQKRMLFDHLVGEREKRRGKL
jgi:hypothetical protein